MSWLTASDRRKAEGEQPVVTMQGVSVRYRLPQERIPSIKEYAIRWLKGKVRFQEFWALENVSFEVKPGEVFGIIGPNGAGKSTLLKVIARVLRPTRGSVRVRGRIAPLLELGAGFDMELTGRENIYLNGAILGYSMAEIEEGLGRVIEFSGLGDFIDAPLRTYSTGMVARLGFAVATDRRPDLLIVDEILSVGDTEFQTRSFERIQSFQAEGTTILLVSHSLARVEQMCSRVMWLDRGNLVAIGATNTVINRYLGRVETQQAEQLAQEGESKPVQRWGSRKIEITGVRICDEGGAEQAVFHTGQRLVLQMDYCAHQPVQSPIFGIAIHRQDGLHLTGPNTGFANLDMGAVAGEGRVRYTIPSLPLLEGLYHFSVAVVDQNDSEIFDYHDRTYSFRVTNQSQQVKERYGLITLRGEWQHLPG
jgi:lipopolysaccharide transport system ATP-binding protein